jgi:peroxiredoxin family protein
MDGAIRKLSFIVSKGSLDGVYPALILANGARAEGIEADVFFTFFGLDAIRRGRVERLKLASVGNPALHVPTLAGALPGVSAAMTRLLNGKLDRQDIPSIPEFLDMIADTGAGLYACKASADLFGLTKDDFVDRVAGVITVGEFYDLAAGGQIVYT